MRHFFVTTPIFYVNAPPHLGHLYTALIADASYRWNLFECGGTCLFVSGTDEHGTKVYKAAKNANVDVKSYCDRISKTFVDLLDRFNIHPTNFVRTTDKTHQLAVQYVWNELKKNGLLSKKIHQGWYSIIDECFYNEEDVEELINNNNSSKISKITRSPVEWVQEENYVFTLSQFLEPIKKWLMRDGTIYPKNYVHPALLCLNEVNEVSVSRDSNRVLWGIGVPDDDSQNIYVWLDALISYLSVTGFPNKKNIYWPPSCQFIGKDILRFHVKLWPAVLMALNLDLPKRIFVHGHWLINNIKMSKSLGNVVDPIAAAGDLTFEGLRYFLLRQGTPNDRANFDILTAKRVVMSDLSNNIGNLLQRSTVKKMNPKQAYPSFDQAILAYKFTDGLIFIRKLNMLHEQCCEHVEELNFHKALETIIDVASDANRIFQKYEPWHLQRTEEIETLLFLVYEALRISNILLQPFIPEFADRSLSRLGIPQGERRFFDAIFGGDPIKHLSNRPLGPNCGIVSPMLEFH